MRSTEYTEESLAPQHAASCDRKITRPYITPQTQVQVVQIAEIFAQPHSCSISEQPTLLLKTIISEKQNSFFFSRSWSYAVNKFLQEDTLFLILLALLTCCAKTRTV